MEACKNKILTNVARPVLQRPPTYRARTCNELQAGGSQGRCALQFALHASAGGAGSEARVLAGDALEKLG